MHKTIFGIGVAGLIFSGYLGGVKLFSGTCVFNEPCPYFLGYPACYFGFVMYFIITFFAGLLMWKSIREETGIGVIFTISILGILFAGYFTIAELPMLFEQGLGAYVLGLPTCALGLIVYIVVAGISWKAKK